MLESLNVEQFDVLDYAQFTDDIRYDDTHYINLSISFPNTFLFSKFREKTKDDITITWCVLKIDPIFLYVKDTLFSVTNAASNAAKYQYEISGDLNNLEMLFLPELNINTYVGSRLLKRTENLKAKYPTDIQAEVLVKDEIPIEFIKSVCFYNEEDMACAKAAMSHLDLPECIVDKSLFSNNRI